MTLAGPSISGCLATMSFSLDPAVAREKREQLLVDGFTVIDDVVPRDANSGGRGGPPGPLGLSIA